MNSKDIICECGHEKKYHGEVTSPIWEQWCNAIKIKDRRKNQFIYACQCYKYTPDNLLHIETLAKKKKLI